MKISVSHNLTKAEALIRIKKLIQSLKAKYGSDIKEVKETWNGAKGELSLKIKSFNIKADIDVDNDSVSLKGDIPFLLKMFSTKIEEIIKTNLKNSLS